MSKRKKPKQNKVDVEYIQKELTSMAMGLLVGRVPETVEVSVKIRLPAPVINVVKHIAEKTGGNVEEVLSKMASEGISRKLQDITSEVTDDTDTPVPVKNPLEELQANLGNIQGKLGGLGEIMEQLKGLEGVFGDKTNL